MKKGYIKLGRQLRAHPIWTGERFTRGQAWVDLLLLAQFSGHEFRIRGNLVILNRGQIGTSKAQLADQWGWNRKTVQKFLDDLEADKMITQQKGRLVSVITIVNYGTWQDTETNESTQERTTEGTTDYPTERTTERTTEGTTLKKGKKVKKVKKVQEQHTGAFVLSNSREAKDTPEAIFEAFNATEGVTVARKLNTKRRMAANARLKDSDWLWREALAKFPLGFQGTETLWLPSLEWFLRPDSVMNVLEGKYDSKDVPRKSTGVDLSKIDLK